MEFVGLVKDSVSPKWTEGTPLVFLKDQLDVATWAVLGAIAQSFMVLALGRLGLIPAFLYMLYKIADAYAIKTGLKRNIYMDGIINTKFSAQFPDSEGRYGSKPANNDVCVFLLGAQVNSPIGILEPNFRRLGDYFDRMTKELKADPGPYGFLGATSWMGTERQSCNATLVVMYFKSYEGVHKFAHGPLHREGWNWWNKELANDKQYSIYHELYQVPRGNWENVYMNMVPTDMSATTHKIVNENGEAKWASPIVDARKGLLKTGAGRMSRSQATEHEEIGIVDSSPYGRADSATKKNS